MAPRNNRATNKDVAEKETAPAAEHVTPTKPTATDTSTPADGVTNMSIDTPLLEISPDLMKELGIEIDLYGDYKIPKISPGSEDSKPAAKTNLLATFEAEATATGAANKTTPAKRKIKFRRANGVSTEIHPRFRGNGKDGISVVCGLPNIDLGNTICHALFFTAGFTQAGDPKASFPNMIMENVVKEELSEWFLEHSILGNDLFPLIGMNGKEISWPAQAKDGRKFDDNRPLGVMCYTEEPMTPQEQTALLVEFANVIGDLTWRNNQIRNPPVLLHPKPIWGADTGLGEWIGENGLIRILKEWHKDFEVGKNWGLKDPKNLAVLKWFYPVGLWSFKNKVIFGVPDDWLSPEGKEKAEAIYKKQKTV